MTSTDWFMAGVTVTIVFYVLLGLILDRLNDYD